ncbi:MAG TPA: hypothetical protein VJZ27_00390, partial [Aggregatilineales bacterium]|nr:hypothetical protein [Aggregatilineales bacterium]
MMPVTRPQKLFFALLLAEAILVAVLGYFFPSRLDSGFSWVVMPPLHARFVASLYFFGVVVMIGGLLARDRRDIQPILPAAVVWTGLLFIVSIYHLDNFDFEKIPVLIWMIAYFVDPLIGLWLIWQGRKTWRLSPSTLPGWIRAYLLLQGSIFS